jgi:hypothetical protein
MANKVVGTTITLTKGDTFKRTLILKDKTTGDIYQPVEGDSIRFAAKKKYTDSTCLIYKEIPTDTMLLHLEPDDTKNLAVGSYVYDIQLTYANGDVDTFIDKAKFTLTEEVE